MTQTHWSKGGFEPWSYISCMRHVQRSHHSHDIWSPQWAAAPLIASVHTDCGHHTGYLHHIQAPRCIVILHLHYCISVLFIFVNLRFLYGIYLCFSYMAANKYYAHLFTCTITFSNAPSNMLRFCCNMVVNRHSLWFSIAIKASNCWYYQLICVVYVIPANWNMWVLDTHDNFAYTIIGFNK